MSSGRSKRLNAMTDLAHSINDFAARLRAANAERASSGIPSMADRMKAVKPLSAIEREAAVDEIDGRFNRVEARWIAKDPNFGYEPISVVADDAQEPKKGKRRPIPSDNIDDPDKPMLLKKAARVAFPDGSMTVSGLRNEIRKGNLEASKVAGRIWTTLNKIERMMTRCSITEAAGDAVRDRSSTCATPSDPVAHGDGSSSTAGPADSASSAAQAHLRKIAHGLRKPSRNISPPSTSPTSAKVVPIRS